MSATAQIDTGEFKNMIEADWGRISHPKVRLYIGKFFERTRTENKIAAKVHGNHGVYLVSIEVKDKGTRSACSCYIGKDGGCHHCYALAHTFLNRPDSFKIIERKTLPKVVALEDISDYLKGTTLDELLKELKAAGVTQKDFAESVGMNPRHLSSIKSSELRNRYYHELGATKLACLWMIERFTRAGKSRRK
ncbi:MAG TPA: hypothetical protein VGC91_00900 [Pyrinomonadaceae bacterium]|jgi:uncharacterized Zn finger protein